MTEASELAGVKAEVGGLRGDISGLRDDVKTRTRWLRRGVVLLVVVVVLLTVAGVRDVVQRNDARTESRCDIRSAIVRVANAAKADPALTLDAIRGLDSDMGTGSCGGVAVCGDGTYSQAVGRPGACSHHGGVDRILIPPN